MSTVGAIQSQVAKGLSQVRQAFGVLLPVVVLRLCN
jgi:hypothetical protein